MFFVLLLFFPTACVDLSVGKYLLVIECGILHTIFKCKCTCALCATIFVTLFQVLKDLAEISASLGLSGE